MAKALEEYTPQKKAEAMSITKELSSISGKIHIAWCFRTVRKSAWMTLRKSRYGKLYEIKLIFNRFYGIMIVAKINDIS